jgi:shikimate kinase
MAYRSIGYDSAPRSAVICWLKMVYATKNVLLNLLYQGVLLKYHSNIVLIGMPGSGKSTIGVLLAKKVSMQFIDTDILIQVNEGRSLQSIIDESGYLKLRSIEECHLTSMVFENHVIATGGSAAYSDRAMNHLRRDGIIVFLNVSIAALLKRIRDFETRGLAKRADQTFEDLFDERFPLYMNYADIVLDSSELDPETTCDKIIEELGRFG